MRVRPTALCALALGLPLAAGNFDVQAQVTLNQPTQDLKTALDGKQGFGLGLHGLHRRGLHHTSRTRFDWNVWAQGVTAGAGWQFTRNLGAEARVLVSSINRTYDSTLLQGAVVFRF